MTKIVISDKGLFLNISGRPSLRTPCTIVVNDSHLESVLFELKRNGISRYKIVNEIKSIKKENKEIIKTENISNQHLTEILDGVKNNDKMLSNIEKLLQDFLKRGNVIIAKSETIEEKPKQTSTRRKTKVSEIVEDFIPEIDVKNIRIKGSKTDEKVIKAKDDIYNLAEKLKSVIKEKE